MYKKPKLVHSLHSSMDGYLAHRKRDPRYASERSSRVEVYSDSHYVPGLTRTIYKHAMAEKKKKKDDDSDSSSDDEGGSGSGKPNTDGKNGFPAKGSDGDGDGEKGEGKKKKKDFKKDDNKNGKPDFMEKKK
jgi:hypothetical protein